MSSIPVLYHAEGSFYSQRARLAFAEKGIAYKSHLINLVDGEVYEEWFLRNVNPKGTVPAMEHGGIFFTDSKDIIEYVDAMPSDRPKLLPAGDSTEDAVRHFWDLLDSVNIAVVTYGSLFHRHLTTNCMAPRFLTKDKIEARLAGMKQQLIAIKQKYPDLVPVLENRRDMSAFAMMVADENSVVRVIDECDKALDEVEKELQNQKAEFGDEEYWLCGRTFTMADIQLSCMLHRLIFIGQADRLFLSNRPLVSDYYQRVLKRNSFNKECVYANSFFWSFCMPMMKSLVKKVRPFLFASSIVALGVYAYYKRDQITEFGQEMYTKYFDGNTTLVETPPIKYIESALPLEN